MLVTVTNGWRPAFPAWLVAARVANESTFALPRIAFLPQYLFPATIGNVSAFGAPSIEIAETTLQTLTQTRIGNASTFGAPTIHAIGSIAPAHIVNESSFGAPILVPDQFLAPARVENVQSFGAPTLENMLQFLAPPRVENASTFGAPTIANAATPAAPIEVFSLGTASAAAKIVPLAIPAGGVPAGSLIVIGVGVGWANGLDGVTDSAGNVYERAARSAHCDIWYCKDCLALAQGDAITTTCAYAAWTRISALYATNVDITAPLDVTGTASGTGTQASVSTPALAESGELVIGWVSQIGNITLVPDPAFTTPPPESRTGSGGYGIFGGLLIAPDTTAQTYSPTFVSSANWYAVIVAFKPAA